MAAFLPEARVFVVVVSSPALFLLLWRRGRPAGTAEAEEADKELEVHPRDAAGSVRLTDH